MRGVSGCGVCQGEGVGRGCGCVRVRVLGEGVGMSGEECGCIGKGEGYVCLERDGRVRGGLGCVREVLYCAS